MTTPKAPAAPEDSTETKAAAALERSTTVAAVSEVGVTVTTAMLAGGSCASLKVDSQWCAVTTA